MRKLIGRKSGLLLRQKYNYIPVSNYEIQKKTNPVIEVSIGSEGRKLFDLQFRVKLSRFSFSKIQSLALVKTLRDCSWELETMKVELLV